MTAAIFWDYVEALRTLEFEARQTPGETDRALAMLAINDLGRRLEAGTHTSMDLMILEEAKSRS
uniref:Uncharacterized protein n=1 Tax=Caulobacter phage BL57 TaxID=3348355 RepID=A0AB74ULR9_9VIRU